MKNFLYYSYLSLICLASFTANAQTMSLMKCETDGTIEYRMPKGKQFDKNCSSLSVYVDENEKKDVVVKTEGTNLSSINLGEKVSLKNDLYSKRYEILNAELVLEKEKKNKLIGKKEQLSEDEFLTALSIIENSIKSLEKELGKNINNSNLNIIENQLTITKAPSSLPTELPNNYIKQSDATNTNTNIAIKNEQTVKKQEPKQVNKVSEKLPKNNNTYQNKNQSITKTENKQEPKKELNNKENSFLDKLLKSTNLKQ